MNLLQGNARTSIFILYAMAYSGVFIGIVCHFFTWRITENTPKEIVSNGFEGLGIIGMVVLVVYGLLLLLRSSYGIILAFFFFAYMLEQLIGSYLLRYMPLSVTKLTPALYVLLPLSALLTLMGSLAPILSQILQEKTKPTT